MMRPGVTFVFGQTYTGKSTLTRKLLEQFKSDSRQLIFDPQCSVAWDGLPELTTLEQCSEFFTGPESTGAWTYVVRFPHPIMYSQLASTAFLWRHIRWVLDDAGTLFSDPELLEVAAQCAVTGRHWGDRHGVELWVITHRPQDAPARLRAQVAAVYSFRQVEPRDLELLTKWCGSDFSDRVKALDGKQSASWPESFPDGQGKGSRPGRNKSQRPTHAKAGVK